MVGGATSGWRRPWTPARAAVLVLALYPVAWVLGLAFAFWPVLFVVLLPVLLRSRLTLISRGLVAVAAVVVLSVPVSVAAGFFVPSRLVGLTANVTVWLAAAGLVHLARTAPEVPRQLARCLVWIGVAQGLLTLAAAAASPAVLPVPLLHGLAGRAPEGVAAFMINGLYVPTWFDGPVHRSSGLMGRPTWGGAFAVVAAAAALWLHRRRRLPMLPLAGVLLLCAVSVYLSYSRAAYLAVAAGVLVTAVVAALRRGGAVVAVTVPLTAGAAVWALTGWQALLSSADEVNAAREGSADSRGAIYSTTWDLIEKLPLPVLGYGVKPQQEDLVASVATHSTYLGLVFRGGFLAALLFCAVLLGTAVVVARARAWTALFLVVFTAVWCVLEDFDPGHLVPLGLVLALGMAAGPPRDARRRRAS